MVGLSFFLTVFIYFLPGQECFTRQAAPYIQISKAAGRRCMCLQDSCCLLLLCSVAHGLLNRL